MRIAKILGGIVGAVVLLLGVALIAVWLLVSPNLFKPKIAAAVLQATGRELEITGDIKLSVFPWVALDLGAATLSSPPGFGDQPFLSLKTATVRVKLLPLLHQQLEISRIEIDGLNLILARNAQGQGNWESAQAAPLEAQPEPATSRHALPSLQALSNIHVTHGRVSYHSYTLQNIDLETGSIGDQHGIPVRLSVAANRGVPAESATLSANFQLGIEPQLKELKIAALNANGTLSQPGGRPTPWNLNSAAIDLDLTKQTVAVPQFASSYSTVNVTGSLTGEILDDWHASGKIALQPFELREFLMRSGWGDVRTRDPKALSALSGSVELNMDAKQLLLEQLQLRLDDTQLKGDVKVDWRNARAVTFDLAADNIDLNRYLAPKEPETPKAPVPVPSANAAALDESAHLMAADGTVTLNHAHFSNLDFNNLKVTLGVHDGVTHLFPIEAQLDGGRYSGDIVYDQRAPVPSLSLDEHLTGVDMAQLLAKTAQKGRLSGRATVNLQASAHGAAADTILKTLNGHADVNIADGAIEGVDVSYQIDQAQSLLSGKSATGVNTKRTKFETCKLSAQITNGVVVTHDLSIDSAAIRISGQGSANLPTKALDLGLVASILKAPATTMVDIPLKITGSYDDPTVKADVESLAKDQLKNKLQDVLKKNGLQGLFGGH